MGLIILTVLFTINRQNGLAKEGQPMSSRTLLSPLPGRRCSTRFYRPAEHDGPGTLTIFEFRCVLRDGHRGRHRVEEIR